MNSHSRTIALLTYGTRGDVEPFIALGEGLRRAGYRVRLLAPGAYAPLAQERQIEFIPLPGDPAELSLAFSDRAGQSWWRMIRSMLQHILPIALQVFRLIEQETRDADLLVHSFLFTDGAHTLAHTRGLPDISAQLFPVFLPTAAFAPVALPDLPLGGAYRRGAHALNTIAFRYGGRLAYRLVRRSAPELPELAPWPFSQHAGGPTPLLLAWSRHVLPAPLDWPEHAHVTGYWNSIPLDGWSPPAALERFLEAGPPPVYFGVGSAQPAHGGAGANRRPGYRSQ